MIVTHIYKINDYIFFNKSKKLINNARLYNHMTELNLKDRKLLYWLDQNSRATNKELAKKIGLSEQAVGYKLRVLEDRGIIKKYVTFVNALALGYSHYKVLLRLQNTNPQKEKEIIDYLVDHKNIRWVVSCSGRWDINFSIMAKTLQEFIEIYRKIESDFGDYISEKNISLLIKSPGFTKGYLLNKNSFRTLEYERRVMEKELDPLDKKILKSISQNARKSIIEIAKEINSTIDIVRYRIKKLENDKIISGYTLQIDLHKINLLRYSVYFSIHKMNIEIERKMIEFARTHNNVVFILTMVGTYDLSLELEVESYEALERIAKDFRDTFAENIRDFEIIFDTHEYKYDFFPLAL